MAKKKKDLDLASSSHLNQIQGSTNAIFNVIFVILALACIIPVVFIFMISISSEHSIKMNGYQFIPSAYSLDSYKFLLREGQMILTALGVSVAVTVIGTVIGVALTMLMGYVLSRSTYKLNGFFTMVVFIPMIFNGGMIPTYLVMKNLGLTNNLLGVVLLPAINIYNLVLMRNFFEGIPQSLFEAATLDGCTPMATFIKVVLPLSKAALASIGLMFAVAYWNDYTNYKLYITDSTLYNFQMKLRSIMMGSDLPQANGGATENTVKSAAIIIAILPFMILYPFLQKYFVKGVNVGAVKG